MTPHECDETCTCCGACYSKTGASVCDRQCPHAEPEEE